jgi:hypothetical protein
MTWPIALRREIDQAAELRIAEKILRRIDPDSLTADERVSLARAAIALAWRLCPQEPDATRH